MEKLNVRGIFDSDNIELKRDYAYTINQFAKHRTFKKDSTPEDRAIKTITDIYYYAPCKVSIKQVDWMIKYATKFKITGDAKKEMFDRLIKAISSTNPSVSYTN